MTTRYGFYLDTRACTGCKACQIACKDKNNLDREILWRSVVEMEAGGWVLQGNAWINDVSAYYLSLACMHCERPICMEVCPTRAITQRDDGIVLIDGSSCIGCRYCQWACPYGAVHYDASRRLMTKCDFCYDLLDQEKLPACVSACQMRVLKFGNIEELRIQHGDVDEMIPLPDKSFTAPAVVLTPHPESARSENITFRVANREEI